jgi:hypothetical protein
VIEINQEREKDRLGELAGPTLTQHDEHQGKEEVISPSGHGSTPEELAASATDNRVIDQPGMFEEILQHWNSTACIEPLAAFNFCTFLTAK